MPDIAVAATSARALVAAANRAGFKAVAFDLFCDGDTQQLAAEAVPLRRLHGLEIDMDDFLQQLDIHVGHSVPIVLGSGFERRPDVIETLNEHYRLVGNSAEVLRQIKDPFSFDKLLTKIDIPHPRVFSGTAPEGLPLLEKAIGRAGGAHVRPASSLAIPSDGYLQEWVEGATMSALFLADGQDIRLLAFSEQWCHGDKDCPYRYGGAAGPIAMPTPIENAVTAALGRLVRSVGLIGLNSADLIIRDDQWSLIEINPRPGATLDVFDHAPLPPLLQLHMKACEGDLPDLAPLRPGTAYGARAASVFYAPMSFEFRLTSLPSHTADQPTFGTFIQEGEPICTMFGEGPTAVDARAVVDLHMQKLWRDIARASRNAAE